MKNTTSFAIILFSLHFIFTSFNASATVVEVRTSAGDFQINLFDNTTPATVANFLSYVNAGAYANNTVHRSVSNFVIQMGGYQYSGAFPPELIATGAPVVNEPSLSNVRGTVAMAKLSGSPNSATSQFFVNLSNNSAGSSSLDTTNGGFTVFGQVIGDGMDIVDQIAMLPTFQSSNFGELPLQNFSSADASSGLLPTDENIIIITDIVVIDAAVVTNPNLVPVQNTLINSQGGSQQPSTSSGGGTFGWATLLSMAFIAIRRKAVAMHTGE